MHYGHENKANDHQVKKLLIVKHILLLRTLENVLRTVWRIYLMMLVAITDNINFQD